jgi:hypothetical protein
MALIFSMAHLTQGLGRWPQRDRFVTPAKNLEDLTSGNLSKILNFTIDLRARVFRPAARRLGEIPSFGSEVAACESPDRTPKGKKRP